MENQYQTPRRNIADQATAAEKAIDNAMAEVEKLEASIILTDAIGLLTNAREKVSDFIDSKLASE